MIENELLQCFLSRSFRSFNEANNLIVLSSTIFNLPSIAFTLSLVALHSSYTFSNVAIVGVVSSAELEFEAPVIGDIAEVEV